MCLNVSQFGIRLELFVSYFSVFTSVRLLCHHCTIYHIYIQYPYYFITLDNAEPDKPGAVHYYQITARL